VASGNTIHGNHTVALTGLSSPPDGKIIVAQTKCHKTKERHHTQHFHSRFTNENNELLKDTFFEEDLSALLKTAFLFSHWHLLPASALVRHNLV
jgi:hypothetical protein